MPPDMSDGKLRILIVEDEPVARARLSSYMQAEGFLTAVAPDGRTMRAELISFAPEVVLLDINLPDESGFALLKDMRDTSNMGIIVVSARQDETDRVVGLELGADDYIVKPFNPRELAVKVRNLAHRVARCEEKGPASETSLRLFDGWHFDLCSRQFFDPHGKEVTLTRGEFDLLAALARHANQALSRTVLLRALRPDTGMEDLSGGDRTVDVLVGRLRRKIGDPSRIATVHGIGYRLVNTESS